MVPEGWTRGVFEDGIELISGQHVEAEYVNNSGVGKPYLTGPADFPNGKIIVSKFTVEGKKFSQKGDLLITVKGSGTGKVIESDDSYAISRQLMAIRPQKFDHGFVFYNLLASISRYEGAATGLIPGISRDDVLHTPILLPPLPEQKKIAQILSTWDKAITITEQLLANSQQQKKALMQQLLTGKKRLLDKNGVRFSGGWRFLTFDEAFKVANKKSAQVKSSNYFATGSVPVVDQGKELIAGYCDNDERYTNVPVIIFGDHTRCLKWVDFEFCPGADGTQVLDSKEFLDKKFGYYLLCHTDIPNLGYSRHMRELKEKDFKVPVDMVEQQKIAAALSSADQEISALQQKLDALKQEKKALMQQLLTGKRRVLVS
ncbi:restriction endonuclease subunit S [Aeromonas caviae]|uniref:restriction endonuclease subunit S n=1 Tax=Aeromonas sp. QDB37 TaxID=2989829 RepID=UPI0022E7D2D3|nr:restriction endonuclease subunit S [Aeromonas sp. QDB37]